MSWSSGTNTIKEGDESKALTLQMLVVKKQGGGTEYFVRKNDVKLGTKSVTQNGTYTAASDGKYGFSQFSVNVAGGNGSADSHGKPTGTIAPGGAGSAVVGTDEDGNDAVVGVDEGGNLVTTPLPSSIVLVTPPTKMDYNDGESIDLSGAVVVAKMADGSTWTDADHPSGHVSCTPEPDKADKSKVKEGGYTSELDVLPLVPPLIVNTSYIRFGSGSLTPGVGYDYDIQIPSGVKLICWYTYGDPGSRWLGILFASTEPATVTQRQIRYGSVYSTTMLSTDHEFTYDGKTVYWYCDTSWSYQHEGGGLQAGTTVDGTNNTLGNYTAREQSDSAAWTIIYGTAVGGGQEITLKWARPGDGKVLSTTMEINVGAHTTESSSGTSGSGGGGTF